MPCIGGCKRQCHLAALAKADDSDEDYDYPDAPHYYEIPDIAPSGPDEEFQEDFAHRAILRTRTPVPPLAAIAPPSKTSGTREHTHLAVR